MTPKIEKLLIDLAEKLGTTAEHLWGVLVRQALVDSITKVLLWIICTLVMVRVFKFVYHKTSHIPEDRSYPEWTECAAVGAWVFYAIVAVCLTIEVFCTISTVAGGFFNPEYWALRQLMPY